MQVLVDEPAAARSPSRQLAALRAIHHLVTRDFLNHSPRRLEGLLATPTETARRAPCAGSMRLSRAGPSGAPASARMRRVIACRVCPGFARKPHLSDNGVARVNIMINR
jgi:hypothetical protein